jgi:hypothetical protein
VDSTGHNDEVIGTTADTTGKNAALTIPIARFTGAADESIGLFARFTAPTRTPYRHRRRLHRHQPVAHRHQRPAQRHNRRADRSHSRLRIGSDAEVTARVEPHIATSGEPTVSLDEMTAPDAEPTGRMRDPSWVAMHQASPAPPR